MHIHPNKKKGTWPECGKDVKIQFCYVLLQNFLLTGYLNQYLKTQIWNFVERLAPAHFLTRSLTTWFKRLISDYTIAGRNHLYISRFISHILLMWELCQGGLSHFEYSDMLLLFLIRQLGNRSPNIYLFFHAHLKTFFGVYVLLQIRIAFTWIRVPVASLTHWTFQSLQTPSFWWPN